MSSQYVLYDYNMKKIKSDTNSIVIIKAIIAFIFLFSGVMIYIIYRTKDLLVFKWIDWLYLNSEVDYLRLSYINLLDNSFLIYNLPGALWVTSYIILINIVNKYNSIINRIIISSALPIIAIISEFLQYFTIINGTFDWLDIICYLFPLIIFIIFLYEKFIRA